MLADIALIVLGYLAGSVASALVVCRAMGLGDPREGGSGNPGATNVLRLHGRNAAFLTLAGDVLKGLLPVLLARLLDAPAGVIALTGLAAFAGHLYPVFFGFRGGKGVATLIGVLFASHWLAGLLFVAAWLLVAAISRYSSLSSLVAAALTPLFVWTTLADVSYVITFTVMALLLFWRHRTNIRGLLAGTEGRIGAKREESEEPGES